MISIRTMHTTEFDSAMAKAHVDYIASIAKINEFNLEQATEYVEKQLGQILPQGFQTPGQHFFVADDRNKFAGFIWFSIKDEGGKKFAWIWNLYVETEYRRKGVAQQLMQSMENEIRSKGIDSICLHVFADNTNAFALYQKSGFKVTSNLMRKKLS